MAAARAPQSRNWVFTYNFPQGEETNITDQDPFPEWHTNPLVGFIVYQVERAPHTGQLHIQGFVNLKQSRKMAWVKKFIHANNTAHVEIAHDVPASILYCMKGESRVHGPWKYGQEPAQGKRTDLITMYEDIKAGKRTHEMLEADPNVARYEKQIKFMRFDALEHASDRQEVGVTVYVFWGSTRCGKTFTAINQFGADGDYFKIDCTNQKGTIWFDGYEGQRLLIIDDFDETLCPIGYLKVLLDKYRLRLPIKGGHTWATFKTVIITSNSPPNTWYPNAKPEDQLALEKRLHQIRHYVLEGEPPVQCRWREVNFNGLPIGPYHEDIIQLNFVPAVPPPLGFLQGLTPEGEPLPPPPVPEPDLDGPVPAPAPAGDDSGDDTEMDENLCAMALEALSKEDALNWDEPMSLFDDILTGTQYDSPSVSERCPFIDAEAVEDNDEDPF